MTPRQMEFCDHATFIESIYQWIDHCYSGAYSRYTGRYVAPGDFTRRCGLGAWFGRIPQDEVHIIPRMTERFDLVVNYRAAALIIYEFDKSGMDFQDVGDVVSTMLCQYLEREGEL